MLASRSSCSSERSRIRIHRTDMYLETCEIYLRSTTMTELVLTGCLERRCRPRTSLLARMEAIYISSSTAAMLSPRGLHPVSHRD
jgi:hypothetical protein